MITSFLGDALGELATIRPVFHSEADFQHELAQVIRSQNPNLDARLEIPLAGGITLDILLIDAGADERFALELKYKTAAWSGEVNGETFTLKNHGADDLGGYDALKDVQRVESLIQAGVATAGATVFLTNEPLYWKPRNPGSRRTNAHMFRIHEGLELSGVRAWGPNTGGSMRGREQDIVLSGQYATTWQPYSLIGDGRGEFRSLTLYVQPTPQAGV